MPTRAALIGAMQGAAPQLVFGVRKPTERRLVAPTGFWARVKQVFAGPAWRSRTGEIEVAVVARDCLVRHADRAAYTRAAEVVLPVGVVVSFVEYDG